MMITNIEDFVKHIPTASGTKWDAIQPFLELAENELIALFLGEDLYDFVNSSTDAKLKNLCARLLCLQAYENAVPFADVVQTPTGFAVVSGGNLVPASKERVERLLSWVGNQIYATADLMVDKIMATPTALSKWATFAHFENLTDCLFLTGNDLARFATFEGSKRKWLMKNKNKLLTWQVNILEKVVSKAYMAKLIVAVRSCTLAPGDAQVIRLCKMILGKLLEGNDTEAAKLCNALSNTLDSDLAMYPDYAGSEEYALKTAPIYENKVEHSTFYFN